MAVSRANNYEHMIDSKNIKSANHQSAAATFEMVIK